MIAIFKREFKSLFWNITGWLFIGITLALFGLYFFVYNLSYGYPYISYSLSAIAFCSCRRKTCKDGSASFDITGIRRKDCFW